MNRRHLARNRFARTSAEGGGGGTGTPPAGTGTPPADGQQGTPPPPKDAVDEHGASLGYPAETKVEDMTDAQRANYWRATSKKIQKQVPNNLAELQENARKWDEYQRSQKPPAEQQADDIRKQTEAQVRLEVARDSALAVLRTNLHTRGKKDDEIDELVQFVNPDSFLTESKLDTGKVNSYLDKIAPTGPGGGGGGLPGQGRHEQTAADRAAAGKNEAERRGWKPAEGKSSLLPTTS